MTTLFILGAGASVSSGLPTYRGDNGIYPTNITNILTTENFRRNPEQIWEQIRNIAKHIPATVNVSITYKYLELFAQKYPKSLFLTQNVDGLIRRVNINNERIWEVHGHLRYMICEKCQKNRKLNLEKPLCTKCGSYCRPPVILFGDSINTKRMERFMGQLSQARPEKIVIIGTSMLFPYLDTLVLRAKQRGCRHIIVIDPCDSNYKYKTRHIKTYSDSGLKLLWFEQNTTNILDQFLLDY